MAAKLPALQFYPGDWKKDVGVQSLSFHDRGVWFELLLLMHDSEQRGKLLLNGRAMPESAISRALGLDNHELKQTLSNLVEYGVASLDEETGALMSRRMVKDEKLRLVRSEAGKQGGNPALLNQIPTTRVKQMPTPSVSVSSSSTKQEPSLPPSNEKGLQARILCETVGCFDMREQSGITQVMDSYGRHSKKTLEDSRDYLITQWEKYGKASPRLEWQYGSAYKFFMSGKWDKFESWPWKPGESPPIAKLKDLGHERAQKHFKEMEDARKQAEREREEDAVRMQPRVESG